MARYRKKPIIFDEVEATQVPAENTTGVEVFQRFVAWLTCHSDLAWSYNWGCALEAFPPNGRLRAEPSEWIVMGPDGDYFVCGSAEFEQQFEAMEGE